MCPITLKDAINLLSSLKDANYGDFLLTMLCNSDSPTYLAAYKTVFPQDVDLEMKQMYTRLQKYFSEKETVNTLL
jgi:hypothetical protein